MNVTRHFSDTRTSEGRVRFLLNSSGVQLVAEGHGWQHSSTHASVAEAATFLAVVPGISQGLYLEALGDLDRRLALERQHVNAA